MFALLFWVEYDILLILKSSSGMRFAIIYSRHFVTTSPNNVWPKIYIAMQFFLIFNLGSQKYLASAIFLLKLIIFSGRVFPKGLPLPHFSSYASVHYILLSCNAYLFLFSSGVVSVTFSMMSLVMCPCFCFFFNFQNVTVCFLRVSCFISSSPVLLVLILNLS